MNDGTVTAMAIVLLCSQRTMKASNDGPRFLYPNYYVAGRRPSLLCLLLIGTAPHQPTTTTQ